MGLHLLEAQGLQALRVVQHVRGLRRHLIGQAQRCTGAKRDSEDRVAPHGHQQESGPQSLVLLTSGWMRLSVLGDPQPSQYAVDFPNRTRAQLHTGTLRKCKVYGV